MPRTLRSTPTLAQMSSKSRVSSELRDVNALAAAKRERAVRVLKKRMAEDEGYKKLQREWVANTDRDEEEKMRRGALGTMHEDDLFYTTVIHQSVALGGAQLNAFPRLKRADH